MILLSHIGIFNSRYKILLQKVNKYKIINGIHDALHFAELAVTWATADNDDNFHI